MPGNPERPLYKLYPQLQGKSVFIAETKVEKFYLIQELTEHLTKMQQMTVVNSTGLYFQGNLLETIKENNIDIAIFHTTTDLDAENVLEAHQAGKKIIVLERANPTSDLALIYKNLRSKGIPSCVKWGNEFEMTQKITDFLAKQF